MSRPIFIAGFFPPPITGQALATERLAELLADVYEVHTINLRQGETDFDMRFASRIREKISKYREAGKRLANTLKHHPDATVLWPAISPEPAGHYRDLLTIMPAFQPGQKVYGVVHWGRFAKLFSSPLTALSSGRLMDRLEGLVFLNKDRAEQCVRWVSPDKSHVIPNTLDRAVICSDAEIESKQKGYDGIRPLRLLFLSHMLPEKGYQDVVEAIYLLQQRSIPVQIIFAGQWLAHKDQYDFERFVEAHRLKETVTHMGPIDDRSKIKSLHLGADVFILPSYLIEGQPLAILEALNAGSPVITTNLGGMVDMIEDGQEGYLVAPQAPLAIADAIQRLIPLEAWLSVSNAARNRYLQDYGAESVLVKWRELLG